MASIAASELESWPQPVNQALIEPATGIVRVCRRGLEPIVLDSTTARKLAAAALDYRDGMVLLAAAEEADRQEAQLTGLMEGRL